MIYSSDAEGNKLIAHYLYDPWKSYQENYFLVDSLKIINKGKLLEYYLTGSDGSSDENLHFSLHRGQQELFHYSPEGNLTSAIVTNYDWSNPGWNKSELVKSYSASYNSQGYLSKEVTFKDKSNRKDKKWTPSTQTVTYAYDKAGLLKEEISSCPETKERVRFQYNYDCIRIRCKQPSALPK